MNGLKNTMTTPRGERVSLRKEDLSPRKITIERKNLDIAIIQTHCGIEIIRGIRAGVILDAYSRNDYEKATLLWPLKKNRYIENVVILCNTKSGDYSIKKGLAAARVRNKTPEGFEIEFSYFKPKRKKAKRRCAKKTVEQHPVTKADNQQNPKEH